METNGDIRSLDPASRHQADRETERDSNREGGKDRGEVQKGEDGTGRLT